MLEALERANLFVVPLDDERGWYRYHHLFAEVLRSHLQQAEPGLLPILQRRASAWYEQQGFIVEAEPHAGHHPCQGSPPRVAQLSQAQDTHYSCCNDGGTSR